MSERYSRHAVILRIGRANERKPGAVFVKGESVMAKLIDWVLEMADGEPIEAISIGEMGWGDYGSENIPNYEVCPKGRPLDWETAKPFLVYDFSSGYGAPGCQAIWAWTKSWIIGISQYDGSTGPFRIPRNPVDAQPEMPGG
jgi:hypothetical protein